MANTTLVKRIFQRHNFTFGELMLNINSVINPAGKQSFKKFGLCELSVDDTIKEIIDKKLSLARFGDGEISIMAREQGVGFQDKNDLLADRLLEVFKSSVPSLLIGLPDQLIYIENSVRKTRKFWMAFLSKHQQFLLQHLKKDTIYGNAHISRFYMIFKNKKKAFSSFEMLKRIWESKHILIVEGEFTRSGVGNDLYQNTASIQRIICPARNAFNVYNKILSEVKLYGRNKLILLALGPTATVLAHDLSLEGFWALDLGHLDVEYMWMLNNAKTKINIKGRYVNESSNIYIEEFDAELLKNYQSQIVCKILT